MIPVAAGVRIWIASGHTDMRKGMNGLALLVQEGLGRDPFAGDVFVFRGRAGSLIKALWHDGIGLSLYAKRLDRGRFVWPATVDGVVPPRRRRDRPWRLHALQNDLELLVVRPASTPAGLNNSQPFNLSTVLIAVHKDCYTALILIRQGGPHRRKTTRTD